MSGRRRLRGAAEVVLERRYRRLLAWYPAGYRAANQDEMLAVALAGAELGQRWPGVGEAASLVGGGLRLRARGLIGVLRTDPWGDVPAGLRPSPGEPCPVAGVSERAPAGA